VHALLRAKPELQFELTPPYTPFASLEVDAEKFVQELCQSFAHRLFGDKSKTFEENIRSRLQKEVTIEQVCNGIKVDLEMLETMG
jgi:hypothetical protein